MPRCAAVDLLAELADEDVDRSVPVGRASPPDALQQLVPRQDSAGLQRERVGEAELGGRQVGAVPVDVGLHVPGVEAELLDHDLLAAARILRAGAAACRSPDTRDELLHREGLDEVVVGADLQGVHPVVLGAARRDDDDRRADALAAGLLDHLPPVDTRKHEVEHADVRPLVPQPGKARLAVRDADCVEARRLEMTRHPLGDDLVVLDDQDLRHFFRTFWRSAHARRAARW